MIIGEKFGIAVVGAEMSINAFSYENGLQSRKAEDDAGT